MINLPKNILLLVLFSGPLAAQEQKDRHVIYISSISWHTGIVVPAYTIPNSFWSPGHDYSEAPYLEIGWGEADYYPYEGFNFWYAVKSVFWPTSSVIHINPLHREIEDYYFDTEVVKIEINNEQLEELRKYITEALKLDKNGRIIPAAKGKYADSYFYNAVEKYYFPKTSNVWAARALKRMNYSISPFWYQTTGCLLNKAKDYGEPVVKEK